MTTTPLMGLVLPTDHGSTGVWDVILDAAFALLDSHDHTTGKGTKVPSGGLNINADVSWSSGGVSRAITDLKAIDFTPGASSGVTGLAGALFISDGTGGLVLNELYYRTMLGSNVQVTLGAALNVAAFSGGFGGDYITASALASYDAASLSFWFQQPGAPRPWARIRSGDVDIYETAASIVNRVRLKSPAALGASLDLTLPNALPGSTSLVQLSSTGVLTASNTVANAITLSGLVTANAGVTVATGQALTVSGTGTLSVGGASTQAAITASGLITANAGATAGANQHITVSGTGIFKHGTKTVSFPGTAFTTSVASNHVSTGELNFSGLNAFGTAPITLPVGARITAVRLFVRDNNASGATKLRADFKSISSIGTATNIASSAVSAGNATNQTLTISPAATTIAAGTFYSVLAIITLQAATDDISVWGCEVDYDQP